MMVAQIWISGKQRKQGLKAKVEQFFKLPFGITKVMNQKNTLFKSIQDYCAQRILEFDLIPKERKEDLKILSNYLLKKYESGEIPKVIVICTHNSRRSHLGQLWLAVGADYYGLPPLQSFSGGTEATAFNPRAVAAMERIGFDIQTEDETANNPEYQIKWSIDQSPYLAFSKKYDTPPNPNKKFAGIMVCTDADENCPVIFGMDLRLALPFEDPKAFDGTELEAQKYDERALQIAREFLFVTSCLTIYQV